MSIQPSSLATRFQGNSVLRFGQFAAALLVLFCSSGTTESLGQSLREAYDAEITPVPRGYLIVNGSYVEPPYTIDLVDQQLRINDLVFTAADFDLTEFKQVEVDRRGSWRSDGWEGRRRSHRVRSFKPIDQLWDACHATAYMDGVVVLSNGMRPMLLESSRSGHDLLVALVKNASKDPGSYQVFEPPVDLNSPEQREAWNHVLAEFNPSPEFLTRAAKTVSDVVLADASSERIVKASLWANSISYPLTLFAMIVVVVAFGHLLSNKPCLEQVPDGAVVSPETRKVVLKSLLIFGLLSVVDLIWTIAANATGTMREMNPLGNELIQDPVRLILFKTLAVSVTITLLYSLHHRPIAQVASWWSCLVLTLLTVRWLTFNSMFM